MVVVLTKGVNRGGGVRLRPLSRRRCGAVVLGLVCAGIGTIASAHVGGPASSGTGWRNRAQVSKPSHDPDDPATDPTQAARNPRRDRHVRASIQQDPSHARRLGLAVHSQAATGRLPDLGPRARGGVCVAAGVLVLAG